MGSSCTKPGASLLPQSVSPHGGYRKANCVFFSPGASVCPCGSKGSDIHRRENPEESFLSHNPAGSHPHPFWLSVPSTARVAPLDLACVFAGGVPVPDADTWLSCKCCGNLGTFGKRDRKNSPKGCVNPRKKLLSRRFFQGISEDPLVILQAPIYTPLRCNKQHGSTPDGLLLGGAKNERPHPTTRANSPRSALHAEKSLEATSSVASSQCPCCGGSSSREEYHSSTYGLWSTTPRRKRFKLTIQDPASQRLTWYKPPLSVLVIKKVRDAQVIQPFLQLVKWLNAEKRMVVFVEATVLEEPLVTSHPSFPSLKDKLMSFREGQDDLTDRIDFIICLGGDGTLLYASSLFQQSVPPVMAFHLGSLGFLTPFKFDNFQEQVTNVLKGHAALTLRSRLRCIILKKEEPGKKEHNPPTNLLVLNEVVIDRGPSPYLSNIDLYLDGKRITSVQGDGLIVSTPTGSTAYAVAAGASMIHPSVPAIMVTPICPHSLSFRPIVVPAGVELMVKLNPDARNTCWASFDGRHHQELYHGNSLRVTTSIYPVPSICAEDQIADWFASLDECLRWNDRKRQKHLDDNVDDDYIVHSLPNAPTTDGIPSRGRGSEMRPSSSQLLHSQPAKNPSFIPPCPEEDSQLTTPELTQSSSSDTLDSLSERHEA